MLHGEYDVYTMVILGFRNPLASGFYVVGMFLPILNASKIDNGKRMIGMIVQVFTSDDVLFLYEVIAVRRHQTSLNDAIAATTPQLWLQTSEGINQTFPKVQLVAKPLSSIPADHGQAHPVAHPYVCS